jgi:histidinol dehydrogenase
MRIKSFDWDGRDAKAIAAKIRGLQPTLGEVSETVAEIIGKVRSDGDRAVAEIEAQVGGGQPEPGETRIDEDAIHSAAARLEPVVLAALKTAAANIRTVAEAQLAEPRRVTLEQGQSVELREVPVGSAGIYAPGGAAAYPSTVLMGGIPAKVAGVEHVVLVTPAGDGDQPISDLVLAAAGIAGVDEVFAIGGAQAIAALAIGTETVTPVDVIAGPGNRYVQEAKRQLFGTVGVDGIAGPSELMAVIDGSADPRWIALDLASQAEHGGDGLLVAVAVAPHHLQALEVEIELLAHRPDSTIGDAPLALVIAPDHQACVELVNAVAPEHLQLACEGSEVLVEEVRTAGCVFTGPYGATAFGDFVAGSNHVLPTGGAGRFAGPLGPRSFRRRIASVRIPQAAARELAPSAATLARAEGFPLHAESAEARGRSADARGLRKEPPVE